MAILTESQNKILALVNSIPAVRNNFWLTGGTALAEFYLQHRYSEDLDFFTVDAENFKLHMRELERKARNEGIRLERRNQADFDTFFGAWAFVGDDKVKIDFAVDAPYRFKKTEFAPAYGIQIENPVDLSCGKVSALFDRAAPRDMIDVYFIHQSIFPLDVLIPWAKNRHGGMDNYMLAISFDQAKHLSPDMLGFPRMIKEFNIENLKRTFETYKHRLINEPFDARPYRDE